MAEVLERITKIVVDRLEVEASEVTLEASFKDDLGADSLDVVEISMAIEQEFNVSVPDEEIVNFKTPRDIVNYLKEHAK